MTNNTYVFACNHSSRFSERVPGSGHNSSAHRLGDLKARFGISPGYVNCTIAFEIVFGGRNLPLERLKVAGNFGNHQVRYIRLDL